MTQQTADKKWFDDLVLELRLRQVHGSAIGDAVASARELLNDTGQRAEDAFGPARDYAAALDLPAAPRYGWVRTSLWPLLLSLLAFLLFNQAAMSWVRSEPMLLSAGQLGALLVPAVLVALLPLYLNVIVRHLWASFMLVFIGASSGIFSAVLAPESAADAWLILDALPWVIATAVVMIAVAILQTIRSRRSGVDDEIVDPTTPTPTDGRGTKALVLVTDWLFPLLAVLMLGLALALR